MSSYLWFLTALASIYSGLVALCVAMDRHYAELYGRGSEPAPTMRLLFRGVGGLGLCLGLWMCIAGNGWGIGFMYWTGILTCNSLALVFLLGYMPRAAVILVWIALSANLLFAVLSKTV